MAIRGIPYISILSTIALIASPLVYAASVNLPQSGQKQCYDNAGTVIDCSGTGQDGEQRAGLEWPDPRFTITYCNSSAPCSNQSADCDNNASTDVVIDNLTGIIWARNANRDSTNVYGTMDWEQALNAANWLTLCGYADWRLPNVNELESLVHAGFKEEICGGPACPTLAAWLNSQGFINAKDVHEGWYWSSTTDEGKSVNNFHNYTWGVDFYFGYVNSANKSSYQNVWPVRTGEGATSPAMVWQTGQTTCYNYAGTEIGCPGTGQDGEIRAGVPLPNPRFSVSGDCMTDNLTGLTWATNSNIIGTRYWYQAITDANALSLCGYSDWRLPNRKESFSLSNETLSWFWTSTTDQIFVGSAYVMQQGGLNRGDKDNVSTLYYVWPVRGGACSNQPIRINSTGYATIQAAYDSAGNGQTILIQAADFSENPDMDRNINIALDGGYDCAFSSNAGSSTISGSMTISKGIVTIDRVTIR
jgi:hypothetical protein